MGTPQTESPDPGLKPYSVAAALQCYGMVRDYDSPNALWTGSKRATRYCCCCCCWLLLLSCAPHCPESLGETRPNSTFSFHVPSCHPLRRQRVHRLSTSSIAFLLTLPHYHYARIPRSLRQVRVSSARHPSHHLGARRCTHGFGSRVRLLSLAQLGPRRELPVAQPVSSAGGHRCDYEMASSGS